MLSLFIKNIKLEMKQSGSPNSSLSEDKSDSDDNIKWLL